MSSLGRTEWLKIRKYPTFWWMMGIILLSYPGINYMVYEHGYMDQLNNKDIGMILKMLANPFAFPEVWHTVAYISSWFVFIPAMAVIMFISNEYTYKTHRQNIIDGWSRKQFMLAKMVDVAIISLVTTITFAITAFIIGAINGSANMWGEIKYVPLFFLQTFSQLSLAFLIALLVRKAIIALGIFLFYYFLLENFIVGYGRDHWGDIGRYFPFEISDRLIPLPRFMIRNESHWNDLMNQANVHIFYTLFLLSITWGLCFWLNNRRDL
jgi:ABC-2 type transport system permease protein